MKRIIIICILILISATTQAKDIDLAFTIGAAYDAATWHSGGLPSPTGGQREYWVGLNYGLQIKYTRWKLQPTIEGGFRKEYFDFSTWQAPIQDTNPRMWRLLGGLTYEFDKGFGIYGLMGITFANYQGSMIEKYPLLYHAHHSEIHDYDLITLKLGGYKVWDTGFYGIKLGPELSMEIFPYRPGFHRCRNFDMGNVVPALSLRTQW